MNENHKILICFCCSIGQEGILFSVKWPFSQNSWHTIASIKVQLATLKYATQLAIQDYRLFEEVVTKYLHDIHIFKPFNPTQKIKLEIIHIVKPLEYEYSVTIRSKIPLAQGPASTFRRLLTPIALLSAVFYYPPLANIVYFQPLSLQKMPMS